MLVIQPWVLRLVSKQGSIQKKLKTGYWLEWPKKVDNSFVSPLLLKLCVANRSWKQIWPAGQLNMLFPIFMKGIAPFILSVNSNALDFQISIFRVCRTADCLNNLWILQNTTLNPKMLKLQRQTWDTLQ